MTAYRIFQQALRELFANFGAVLRISGPLFLIGVLLAIGVRALMVAAMARAEAVTLLQGAAGMCLIAYILLATIWVAVSWHRFVLLGEAPRGIFPRWHAQRMLAYLGRLVVIGLLIALIVFIVANVSIIVGEIVGSLSLGQPRAGKFLAFVILGLVLDLIGFWAVLRISPILPAAALGEPLTIGRAWKATARARTPLFVLAALVLLMVIVLRLPGALLFQTSLLLGVIWIVLLRWFFIMFGISLVTTLYARYVLKRP